MREEAEVKTRRYSELQIFHIIEEVESDLGYFLCDLTIPPFGYILDDSIWIAQAFVKIQ